jgi:hypothetical protein
MMNLPKFTELNKANFELAPDNVKLLVLRDQLQLLSRDYQSSSCLDLIEAIGNRLNELELQRTELQQQNKDLEERMKTIGKNLDRTIQTMKEMLNGA